MTKISKRLLAASELVREGARVADVGTDHAYLPIYLCERGWAVGGVASDINRGPLERAEQNIRGAGLSDRLATVLCDGLWGLESYAPTDILILGMGGELIARILGDAPWIQKKGIRLILQPMTHPEEVRGFLGSHGFSITEERIVEEDKLYQVMAAEYTGERTEYNEVECLLGRWNIERGGEALLALCDRYLAVFAERKRGRESAGVDVSEETRMIAALKKIKEEQK